MCGDAPMKATQHSAPAKLPKKMMSQLSGTCHALTLPRISDIGMNTDVSTLVLRSERWGGRTEVGGEQFLAGQDEEEEAHGEEEGGEEVEEGGILRFERRRAGLDHLD